MSKRTTMVDEAVDLPLLQKIQEQYVRRAKLLGSRDTGNLKFAPKDLAGAALLKAFVEHLQQLPPRFVRANEKFGCPEHCRNGSCPPCFAWKRSQYEDYLRYLRAANNATQEAVYLRLAHNVDLELLQKIHARYVKRATVEQRRNAAFKLPEFAERGLTGGKLLFAFVEYLQGLPQNFSDNYGCDPEERCSNGACPPCFDWTREQYERYLKKLR